MLLNQFGCLSAASMWQRLVQRSRITRHLARRAGRKALGRESWSRLAEVLEARVLLTDFGDAPLPYFTTVAENGARHTDTGPTLGTLRDGETDGVHSATAVADDTVGGADDEDGVTFGTLRIGALSATVTVVVANAPSGAKLDAWIDFNADGSWGGPGEQISANLAIANGSNPLIFDVPSWAADGATFARFRISTAGNLSPEGLAADGEVEDHLVTILSPVAASGVFNPQNVISTAADIAQSVFAADVDGDGDMDALSASAGDDAIAWYENNGSQSFTLHHVNSPDPDASGSGANGDADAPTSVFAADVDGDGDVDVLSASQLDNKIAWYENDGSQVFTQRVISTVAINARSVFAADLDGDGDLDVLSASPNDNTLAWYDNDGNQNFTDRTISTQAYGAQSVFAADVDGDGDLDVLSATTTNDRIAWWENNGSQTFTQRIIANTADGANSVVAADVDGDGDMDALSASFYDDEIAWYENNGSQVFTSHSVNTPDPDAPSTGANGNANGPSAVFAADVDGDGDLDVLSSSVVDDKIAWYENDGSQNFTQQPISTAADGAKSVFAADVDGDGDLDVLSASATDDEIAWYENLPVDLTPPSTTSIVRQTPSSELTNANALVFHITFSEAVTGIDLTDFVVNGTTTATVISVSAITSLSCDATVGGGNLSGFNGTVGLNISGTVSITDLFGNALPVAEPPTDEIYTLDNVAPVPDIVDIAPDPRATPVGTVTINFTESVTGVDIADFGLTFNGGTVSLAGLTVAGSGSNYTLDLSTVTNSFGSFVLTIAASGSGITDATGNVMAFNQSDAWTIANPTVSLGLDPNTLSEAGGTATVTATLSTVSSLDVTVTLGFTGTATNVTDYTRSATQIVIAAGNTTGTVTLTGVQDTQDEPLETIQVDITGVTNGTEAGNAVFATLIDDDLPPTVTLSVAPATFDEAAGTATVTATLSAASGNTVTVDLGFSGTATIGDDYATSGTQIVITAGNTTGTATLTGVQETLNETDETILVAITNVTNGLESGSQEATATILDQKFNVRINSSGQLVLTDIAVGGRADRLTVSFDSAVQEVVIIDSINPLTTSAGFLVGPSQVRVPLSQITNRALVAELNNGDDSLSLASLSASVFLLGTNLSGGAGADSLEGSAGDDTISAGGGNDLVLGGAGRDSVTGAAGADSIVGGDGIDTVFGGAGNDTLVGEAGNDILNGQDNDDSILGGAGLDKLAGAAGNDFIDGGLDNDTLNGDAGIDNLFGREGNDLLVGGDDGDRLEGEAGIDRLRGEKGLDTLLGGAGEDSLFGGADADSLDGEADNDAVFGDFGDDTVRGGTGDDLLRGHAGQDVIDGGDGISDKATEEIDLEFTINGLTFTSVFHGTETVVGIERFNLNGSANANLIDARLSSLKVLIQGNAGADTLLGSAFVDNIFGGDDDDVISGGGGNDVLDGGAGTDVLYEKADTNFTVNGLQLTSAATGTETATTIEGIVLIGGASANTLNASAASVSVTLLGGGGNDSLIGSAQADVLIGGNRANSDAGTDTLTGNAGADTFDNDAPPDTHTDVTGSDFVISNVFAGLPDWIDAI